MSGLDHDKHRAMQARALANGGKAIRLSEFEWDLSGGCTSPTIRLMRSRPYKAVGDLSRETLVGDASKGIQKHGKLPGNVPTETRLLVRCRKCQKCMGAKAMHWRDRILYELHQAQRTWFGTLTLHPDIQFRMLLQARQKYDAGSGYQATPDDFIGPVWPQRALKTFDGLSIDRQFGLQCGLFYSEVQKYWKRIRKKNQAVFKYVVVFEKHTEKLSGFPHAHFLLHERSGTIRHRELAEEWELGFTNFKLVEGDKAASYITKYLTKDASSRPRGSTDYGRDRVISVEPAESQRLLECEAPERSE